MMFPIILCGGSGTRLWPFSRQSKPKQFLSLLNEDTLLQNTINRVKPLGNPVLLSSLAFKDYLPDYPTIFEPSGRDTGPACITASLLFQPDDYLLFLPSDHHIVEDQLFREEILKAQVKASEGNIVVFGLKPTRPETGFGYIRYDSEGKVESFLEKPTLKVAEQLIQENTLWNAGILFFQVKHFHRYCMEICPEYFKLCQQCITDNSINDNYHTLPKISIDHLFNEKCKEMVVHPLDITWNDIGSWAAIWDLSNKDQNLNVGSGTFIQSTHNLVKSNKPVVLFDMEQTVVLDHPEALLIFPMSSSSKLKDIFPHLPSGLI